MGQKAYLFLVWPPEGEDCPGALAAVIRTSPKTALKSLREARLKVTNKDPIYVTSDVDIFENQPVVAILWQPTGEEKWIRLGS